MANKIIEKDNQISIRLDNAYVSGKNFFTTPFINDDGDERFFGSFRFTNADEAKATLTEAVKMLRKKNQAVQDTIFYGQYPKWEEHAQYGKKLKVNNRVKFLRDITTKEEVSETNQEDFLYAIEVHLSVTKNNDIFLRVARAVVIKPLEGRYNDELFSGDNDNDDINSDDLPF